MKLSDAIWNHLYVRLRGGATRNEKGVFATGNTSCKTCMPKKDGGPAEAMGEKFGSSEISLNVQNFGMVIGDRNVNGWDGAVNAAELRHNMPWPDGQRQRAKAANRRKGKKSSLSIRSNKRKR